MVNDHVAECPTGSLTRPSKPEHVSGYGTDIDQSPALSGFDVGKASTDRDPPDRLISNCSPEPVSKWPSGLNPTENPPLAAR